jgi:DNA-binding GntR family transcriptional regulator
MTILPKATLVPRTRTRDAIVSVIRAWIVDGELAPGATLNIAELAAALDTGRTPVREALIQLEAEGLVETEPQRWTRVTPLSMAEVESLYPVWIHLEVLSAQLAARRLKAGASLAAVEDAQRAFADVVARAVAMPDADLRVAVREADDRFHQAILDLAGNRHLANARQPLRVLARRYENAFFSHARLIGPRSVADHERMIDALRRADENAAAAAMRANMERTYELIEQLVQGATPQR